MLLLVKRLPRRVPTQLLRWSLLPTSWAFTTMATLGHGNGPATVPGRVVAALLMVLGIVCFGLVTAPIDLSSRPKQGLLIPAVVGARA